MSASGGMSQLLKGIIIGVVLIMAIIGTMSLLDKDNPLSSFTKKKSDITSTQVNKDIVAPSITLNPDNSKNVSNSSNTSTIGDLNAEIIDESNDSNQDNIANNETNPKPVLEDERTPEEAINKEPPVVFGMMEINTVNSSNNQPLKANYTVFDKDNKRIAESNDASSASYRLPSGQYKVETTLMKVDEATNQKVPVLTKSRYMIVRENSTANQTFELEPPASTGVLQVSAKMNNQIIRANFVIQKANGEIVASRNNVTNSLFKLGTGAYKVSVSSGNNKDFRSVEVKAGESTQTVFILKEATTQGKLLVRIFDTRSSNPVRANITISKSNGSVVQDLKASTQTELSLAAGEYNISVVGPNGTSNKSVRINSGQALSEIFRFDTSNPDIASTDNSNTNGTQINDNVTIKPVETQPVTQIEPEPETTTNNDTVTLNVFSKDEITGKPMKSNVYIQTMQGQHLDKKTYVDKANFNLKPGVYKVTVRAKNRTNNVKTIRLSKNQDISETFLLRNPNNRTPEPAIKEVASNSTPVTPTNTQKIIPTGFLNVSMQAPNNQQVNRNTLRSDFIVTKVSGEKIVELAKVPGGNFKLDIGNYFVTAVYNNKRQRRRISVKQNQNTRLNFITSDFLLEKGVLRSRIVDEVGRGLKGNLIVRNMAGKIVAQANQVSSAIFNLPPVRHTVIVNYEGLSGSEVIRISPNETTVQTFTIASNNNSNRNNDQQRNNSRDVKEILKEKIQKEIRRTFQ